tara:strand:+ start:10538 stop:10990 length:453 start_codon:yes stop_codon:yes gene_type:complete
VDKLEEAKKLLKTAIETDDAELVSMANKILQKAKIESAGFQAKIEIKDVPQDKAVGRNNNEEEFLTPITKPDTMPTHRGSPVNDVSNRVNQFVDDGSEARDVTTPDFQPVERRRKPIQNVKQTCGQCNQECSVHPTHVREFFTCDRCLKK